MLIDELLNEAHGPYGPRLSISARLRIVAAVPLADVPAAEDQRRPK